MPSTLRPTGLPSVPDRLRSQLAQSFRHHARRREQYFPNLLIHAKCQAAAGCRGDATRLKVRREHRELRATLNQSASQAGCAAPLLQTMSPRNAKGSGSPAPRPEGILAGCESRRRPRPIICNSRSVNCHSFRRLSARAIGRSVNSAIDDALHAYSETEGLQPLTFTGGTLGRRHESISHSRYPSLACSEAFFETFRMPLSCPLPSSSTSRVFFGNSSNGVKD